MGVHIFWDSRAPIGLSRPVTEKLSTVLNVPISRIDNGTFPLEGFDASRNQYDAMKILAKMDMFRERNPELFKPKEMDLDFYHQNHHIYEKFLLITSGDLFSPMTSFVFGLANIKFGVAVVSATRLSNTYYNRYNDDTALIKRLVTESAHEIAHLYGLEHCSQNECIMYCPNNLDDLDRKDEIFCSKCYSELSTRIRRRYSP
ncbi:MAG TPA: peptidase M54 [Methanocorpusculum sp.]|mgnify:CR=1 FL=1|nr:peptidase M54 [Methanocorpusculum sp.]